MCTELLSPGVNPIAVNKYNYLLTNVSQYIPVDQALHPWGFDASLTDHTVSLVQGVKPHIRKKRDSNPGISRLLFMSWLIK